MATVPQFPAGTLSRSALNTFVTEVTTNTDNSNIAAGAGIVDSKLTIPLRLKMTNRQGGSSSVWTTAGTSTQTVNGPVVVQGGAITSGSEQSSGTFVFSTVTVTFPTAYSQKPLVFANTQSGASWVKVDVTSATQATLTVWSTATGNVAGVVVNWLAIGE